MSNIIYFILKKQVEISLRIKKKYGIIEENNSGATKIETINNNFGKLSFFAHSL